MANHKLVDNGKTYIMDQDAFSTLMAHGILVEQQRSTHRLATADELRSDPSSVGVGNPRAEAVMTVMRTLLHLPLEGGKNENKFEDDLGMGVNGKET